MIPERLAALRQEMEKRDIAVYIVPTADFHESEYVGEYFKARRFITGFTGSAGTAVITRTKAGLWTDGRYFVQAAKQLEGTTVTLYRMGEEHVPTVDEYVEQTLKEGGTIGFDGRVVNGRWGAKLQQIAEKKHGKLYVQEDLIGQIWKDRPPMSKEPVWILDEAYSIGRRHPSIPLIAGFEKEEKRKILRAFPGADYMICSIPCTQEQKQFIKEELHEAMKNRYRYHYTILGLPFLLFGKQFYQKNHYTCSSYAAELLEKAGVCTWNKHFSLVTPKDFYEYKGKQKIFEGSLRELTEREKKTYPEYGTLTFPPISRPAYLSAAGNYITMAHVHNVREEERKGRRRSHGRKIAEIFGGGRHRFPQKIRRTHCRRPCAGKRTGSTGTGCQNRPGKR